LQEPLLKGRKQLLHCSLKPSTFKHSRLLQGKTCIKRLGLQFLQVFWLRVQASGSGMNWFWLQTCKTNFKVFPLPFVNCE
jgi:hypothetical protein